MFPKKVPLAPRHERERGTALLEAAIVAPIFLMLLLGALESGMWFYERLSVANMSLAGARSASGQGSEALADYYVLQAVRGGNGGMVGGTIDLIVVYRASGPQAVVPGACKTASVSTSCNRYVASDMVRAKDQFGCVGPPGPLTKIDSSWCPTSRKTALSGPGGPPDYIGVYVEARHHDLTGVLGREVTLRSDTVFRMEPRTLT